MSVKPYLVSSMEVGLERDMEPWLLPDTAFPTLEDAYVWRKRVKRRLGNAFLGRLSTETSQTYVGAVSSVATTYTNSASPLSNLPVRPFSVTVVINTLTFTDNGNGVMMLGIVVAGSINYETGVFSVGFTAIGGVGPYDVVVTYSYFPCLSVMGLCTWERPAINIEDLIAFDTTKANLFNNATQFFDDITFYDTSDAPFSWTGTDIQFFDYENYQNAFFATNFVAGNQIQQITSITLANPTVINFAANSNVIKTGDRVYLQNISSTVGAALNNQSWVVIADSASSISINFDSSALAGTGGQAFVLQEEFNGDGIRWYADDSSVDGWVNFEPPLNGLTVLKGARIILAYKDRLLTFSPIEGLASSTQAITYRNRVRWSQNGTVFYTLPVPDNQTADALAWRDDIPGRGGYVDAPTNEAIVSVEFIRDILIVFFERSTWSLRYTGNEALPFVWARVNVEFGSSSQFSTVPFDRGVLAVGQRAIITADGNNVSRIDLQIPYTIFDFINNSTSAARVHGIRDYYNELVFWTYVNVSSGLPNDVQTSVYPTKLLVYNYRESSYSIFRDAYTCFGYYQPRVSYLWNTANFLWNEANFNWNSAEAQKLIPKVVAGTNMGYVMIMTQDTGNDKQIAISNITQDIRAIITTPAPHALESGQFVKFSEVQGMTQINNLNTKVEVISPTTFKALDINSSAFSAYTVAGQLTRINNFRILTKRFNPFSNQGQSVALNKMDLYTDYVKDGAISIYVYSDSNSTLPVNVAAPGQNQFWQVTFPLDLTTNDINVDKTWSRFQVYARGQFVQLEFTLSNAQMLDDIVNTCEFSLHGMMLYMGGTGRLISR